MSGNTLSGGGTVTYDTSAAKFGTGALSGGYGYSSTSNLPASGAFTAECWFKYSSTTGIQVFLGQSSSYWMGFSSGSFVGHYGFNTSEVTLTSSTTPTPGVWHHAALTVDPSAGGKLYLDGVLVASSAVGGTAAGVTYLASSTNPFSINNFNSAGGGFNYQFPGEVDEVATWSGVKYTAAFTPPAAPYTGSEGMLALYHLDSNGIDSSAAAISIAPNAPSIVYSPYNWTAPDATSIKTICAGAYFKTMFTGKTCVLNFDITNNSSPLSEIWYRIDGEGPWTQANVAATVSCVIPPSTLNNADIPYHLLEVEVKSTSETLTRWGATSATAVVFTGLTLDNGATISAPIISPVSLALLGDSITEGVRVLGEAAANDTDRNDAKLGWARRVAELLGAEYGLIGFGGSGFTVTGSGSIPPWGGNGDAFDNVMYGVPRSWATPPTAVIINLGTNDGTSNITANATALLNKAIAITTGPVIVVRPFKGTQQAANLQAAIAACSNPSQCFYLDTSGVLNAVYGVDGLGLHPAGPNNLGRIAPALLTLIRPLIAPNAGAFPTTTTAASSDMAVVIQGGQTRAISITNLKAAVAASS